MSAISRFRAAFGRFTTRYKAWLWRNRWKLISGWIMIFSLVVVLGIHSNRHLITENKRLTSENNQRIQDIKANQRRIQLSRLHSCRQNYEGIRRVFQPFFPPKKSATPKQLSDLMKFNNTIDRLKHRCIKQVGTTKVVKP